MKSRESKAFFLLVVLAIAAALVACGEKAKLAPEMQAHLDEYERLIETYEAKFAEAGQDQEARARVSSSYTQEAQAWMARWEAVAPDLSDAEGRAIKAQIDKLNQRALKMLR